MTFKPLKITNRTYIYSYINTQILSILLLFCAQLQITYIIIKFMPAQSCCTCEHFPYAGTYTYIQFTYITYIIPHGCFMAQVIQYSIQQLYFLQILLCECYISSYMNIDKYIHTCYYSTVTQIIQCISLQHKPTRQFLHWFNKSILCCQSSSRVVHWLSN